MSEQHKRVDHMQKIVLHLTAGTTPEAMNLVSQPVSFDFIFGVGVDGLTPFEYALAHKAEGDQVVLPLEMKTFASTFKHLNPPLNPGSWNSPAFYLTVGVAEILPADRREIVKAMAHATGCDDGCCGEGACGHT